MPGQVGCDDREPVRERVRRPLPGLRGIRDAVEQKQDGTMTGGPVRDRVAVDLHFVALELHVSSLPVTRKQNREWSGHGQ